MVARKASKSQPARSLQLDEHRTFQERFWTFERWCWLGFAVLIGLALSGLTGGSGPLSRGTVASPQGVVDYPNVAHWQTVNEIGVTLAPGAGERSLTLSRGFADAFALEAVRPEPARTETRADGHRLIFNVAPDNVAEVYLTVRPRRPGAFGDYLAIDGAPPVAAQTIVLP